MIKIKQLQLDIKISGEPIPPKSFVSLVFTESVGQIPTCEITLKDRDFKYMGIRGGDIVEISFSILNEPITKLKFIVNNVITSSITISDWTVVISGILDLNKFITETKQQFLENATTKDVITSFQNIDVIWDTKITPKDNQVWIRYGISELQWLKSIYQFINFGNDTPIIHLDLLKRLKIVAIKEKLSDDPKATFFFVKKELNHNEFQMKEVKFQTDRTNYFLLPKNAVFVEYDYLSKKETKHKIANNNSLLGVSSLKGTDLYLGNTYKDYFKVKYNNISKWVEFLSDSLIVLISQGWIGLDTLSVFDVIRINIGENLSYNNKDKFPKKWMITGRKITNNANASFDYKIKLNTLREVGE